MQFKLPTQLQQRALSQVGYDGPSDQDSIEKFIAGSPSAAAHLGKVGEAARKRYEMLTQSTVDKGFAEGGTVTTPQSDLDLAQQQLADAQKAATTSPEDQTALEGLTTAQQGLQTAQDAFTLTGVPSGAEAVGKAISTPQDLVTQATVAPITQTPDQFVAEGAGEAQAVAPVQAVTTGPAEQAVVPTTTETATVEAEKATPAITTALEDVTAATGEPSKKATVQGQLEGLMEQFEGGATPPWASGAMRQAMSVMQARGLGASSVAGQAITQAAMESAIAIADRDAATVAQFEMQNLNNEQQTLIFKTQQRISGILSDQSQVNAAAQFNAASENQTSQFFAGLQESVSKFNADQVNAIRQFNSGQTNAMAQFNSQVENQRAQFNANNSLVIAQANAKWRQDISTLDTAAQNEATMTTAKAATGLTQLAMDEIWQKERDLLAFAFSSGESAADREVDLFLANKKYSDLEAQRSDNESTAKWALAAKILMDIW